MTSSHAFESRIAKQALLEWVKNSLPIDRILHETFQEHRVGAAQRAPISNVVYSLVRFWPLYVKGPANPENRDWMRDFEETILAAFSVSPESHLKKHFSVKP